MSCPFPGMDPFLEDPAFWPDFHTTFLLCWREALAESLPSGYEARIAEWVQVVSKRPRRVKYMEPDLTVSRGKRAARRREAAAVATLEPVRVPHLLPSSRRQGYIQLLHRPERSVVAVLELLSPANKENPGRQQYLHKRQELLRQPVHLVELDLLLGGQRLPMNAPLPAGDYYYLVSPVDERPGCDVYAWSVGDALPRLPVPLRVPDADLLIDLREVFATAYARGRYAGSIDYASAPPVRVPPALLARARRGRRA